MMISDAYLVDCPIDDDDEDEEQLVLSAPPPPEFASKNPTPSPKPPTAPGTPAPSPSPKPPSAPGTPAPSPSPPVNRDPYGINQHLKVEVSDVLAEPLSPRSIDSVWVYSVVGFEQTRVWSYRLLSLLLAVPLALLSGLLLGLLACLHVWCVVPCVQLSHTFLPCVRSLLGCAVDVLLAPLCSSLALCCSHVTVTMTNNKDWQPLKPPPQLV